MVSLIGEPRRVADQLIGLGEGFFVPLFFVVLGARLDLRALVHSRDDFLLFVLLAVATTLVPVAHGRDRAAPALERAARGGRDGRAVGDRGARPRDRTRSGPVRPPRSSARPPSRSRSRSVGALRIGASRVDQPTRTGRRGVNTNVAPPLIFASAISGASFAGAAAGSITASYANRSSPRVATG